MNELITKQNDGSISVALPFSPETLVSIKDGFLPHIADANGRVEERKRQLEALGNLDEAPIEAVKALLSAVNEDDATILDYCTKAAEDFARFFGFDAFVTQTSAKKGRSFDPICARGRLREMAKVLKARVDAEKVEAPRHTYVIQIEISDDGLKDVVKTIKRHTDKFRWAVPQGDKGMRQAEKFFVDNI